MLAGFLNVLVQHADLLLPYYNNCVVSIHALC